MLVKRPLEYFDKNVIFSFFKLFFPLDEVTNIMRLKNAIISTLKLNKQRFN